MIPPTRSHTVNQADEDSEILLAWIGKSSGEEEESMNSMLGQAFDDAVDNHK